MTINGQVNGQSKAPVQIPQVAKPAQPTAAEYAALQAQIAQLQAELAVKKSDKVGFKVSEKKAVTLTNIRRMGVTLYADELVRILRAAEDAKAFIKANFDELSYKTVESANKVAEYVGHEVKELDR